LQYLRRKNPFDAALRYGNAMRNAEPQHAVSPSGSQRVTRVQPSSESPHARAESLGGDTAVTAKGEAELYDLLEMGRDVLSPMEQRLIRFVQHTFYSKPWDRTIRAAQRRFGAIWIEHVMKNVRTVHGAERLPQFDPKKSYVIVANHRSFFDLFVVTGYLVYRDMLKHRILFPVRSKFFYDSPLGLAVNGAACFFAMYPPVFRERDRARLNLATLDETARLLRGGGIYVGLHPEGQRNLTGDPYTLLPAKFGVGRIIHNCDAIVLPVFINGLGNDAVQQVRGNFDGTGGSVNVVFGAPLDLRAQRSLPGSHSVYRDVSQAALDAVHQLGQEEKAIREAARNSVK
jgi:1-acyl-sn-glycerol-3-phosphate acyltransferase